MAPTALETARRNLQSLPDEGLPETDGVPMESDWHRRAMNLLIDSVEYARRGRNDYYVGGNMFIYYNEEGTRDRDFRGPDFFYVQGVNREPMRPYWAVWKENGRFPDVIIELLSPRTAVEDLTTKKDIYEQVFRTPEFFCYDPDTGILYGWRLDNGRYDRIRPNEKGWLRSNVLGLWLGTWEGVRGGNQATWLRFYDDQGQVVPTESEAEQQRAEEERRRADSAEAELAQLRARLAQLEAGK